MGNRKVTLTVECMTPCPYYYRGKSDVPQWTWKCTHPNQVNKGCRERGDVNPGVPNDCPLATPEQQQEWRLEGLLEKRNEVKSRIRSLEEAKEQAEKEWRDLNADIYALSKEKP